MLVSKFCDGKSVAEKMPGWPFDGVPVKRCKGMIYWYVWGEHTFDIRVIRKLLGAEEEITADKWFMEKKPDPCGSFQKVMVHLERLVAGRNFGEIMQMHDAALDREQEQEEKSRAAMLEKQKALPARFVAGELDAFPF